MDTGSHGSRQALPLSGEIRVHPWFIPFEIPREVAKEAKNARPSGSVGTSPPQKPRAKSVFTSWIRPAKDRVLLVFVKSLAGGW